MKSILFGLGALALLVAQPIQAKVIDKNKAFNLCKSEVKSEFIGATRYRLRGIKDRGAGFQISLCCISPKATRKYSVSWIDIQEQRNLLNCKSRYIVCLE